MIEAQRMTDEEIEGRRANLAFIREHKPGAPEDDHTFATTLLMQEQWLVTVDLLQAQVDGMREEGCAALGLVENIFNGLTAKGKPSDIILAQMAEAAAKLLAEATPCGHKVLAEEAEAHLKTAKWVLEMDDPRLLKALQTIERLIAERDEARAQAERRREALVEPINDSHGRPTLRGCKSCRNLWKKDGPEKHLGDCAAIEEKKHE